MSVQKYRLFVDYTGISSVIFLQIRQIHSQKNRIMAKNIVCVKHNLGIETHIYCISLLRFLSRFEKFSVINFTPPVPHCHTTPPNFTPNPR